MNSILSPPPLSPTLDSPSPTPPSSPSKPSIKPTNNNISITETHPLFLTPPPPPSKTRTKTKRKPNNTRKPSKRSEKGIVIREEDDDGGDDHVRRPKKRKQHQSKQPMPSVDEDKLPLVASIPSSSPVMDCGLDGGCRSGDSNVWEMISELVMWKDVAKSALWFGSGSFFFMSSCFSKGSNFSMISAASHLGILMLGMAFFNDCLPKRERENSREVKFQLTEEDFLRAARVILPMTNSVLAKSQKIFSGEPSMTLKVAPVLFLASKYGHLITPWRLLATGFFLSFTLPKLYSSNSEKIHQRVEEVNSYVKEAWKSCPRKKFIATSTAMVLWNMCSVKMCMFAVLLRHQHQQHRGSVSGETEGREGEQQQEMIVGD